MPSHYTNEAHAPVLSLTRIVDRSTILELSARLTRWTEAGNPLNQSDVDRLNRKTSGVNIPQFNPENNPSNLVPNATFGGVISNSPNTSFNSRFPLRGAETPIFTDAILTRTTGPHVTKFGLYLERWRAVKGESGDWAGTLDFSTDTNNPGDANHPFANALLGNFKSYKESNTRPPLYENSTSLEWFAQDNWKVTRRFTLDLGLRFGWSTPFYSPRRQEAGFVPGLWDPSQHVLLMNPVRINNTRRAQNPLTGELYPASVIGAVVPGYGNPSDGTVNLLTDPNYPHGLRNNSGIKAAPRFGFAWQPFGDGKTVIRGGFGLFYEIHEKDLWSYGLHLDPPNQLTPQIFYGDLNTFTGAQGFIFPSSTSGLDPGCALGRTMSYSFGMQRSLGSGIILDAAYVGTLGRHLLERQNLNSIPAGTTLQPSAQDPSNPGSVLPTQYLRPYLGYNDIFFYNYDSNSSYHSLQVSADRRFSRGLQGGLAWTWSKAMDYADSDTATLSSLVSPRVWNYGPAGYDRTHILKGHWIYALPRGSRQLPSHLKGLQRAALDGWQLSGINTFMSGAPSGVTLALTSGSANNWSGSPTDAARPMIVGDPSLPKSERTFEKNLRVDAFALPPQGTLGNAAKAVYRDPGIANWDVSLFKNFALTERYKGQLRWEAYNAFNHTQFSSLDNTIKFDNKTGAPTTTTFGQYDASRLPRRMQLALRITF
jgi:hypothetical protein